MSYRARLFSGQYFIGRGRSFAASSTTPAADTLYAIPFDQLLTVDAVALYNKMGGSNGPAARIGIYSNDSATGLPDDLIFGSDELGLTDGQQGLRTAELSTNFTSTDGFWVAAVFSGDPCASLAACSITSVFSQEAFGNYDISVSAPPRHGVQVGYSYAALPSTFPSSAGASITTMALAVRGA